MARPVLANKLFTEYQGTMNKEWLPPYHLPLEYDEQKKVFLKNNNERIQNDWSNKSLPTIDKVPSNGKQEPDVKDIRPVPPSLQHATNIVNEIKWTPVHFP